MAKRILIVDDNEDLADSECMILSLTGHECKIARNVEDAVRLADEFHPDVVLFDLKMPGDGFRLPILLRKLPAPSPKLIAITGMPNESLEARLRSVGVDIYLIKPVEPTTLLNAVESNSGGRFD